MTIFELSHTDHEMSSRYLFSRPGATETEWREACRDAFMEAAEWFLTIGILLGEGYIQDMPIWWSELTAMASRHLENRGWTRIHPIRYEAWGCGITRAEENGVKPDGSNEPPLTEAMLARVIEKNRELAEKELDA